MLGNRATFTFFTSWPIVNTANISSDAAFSFEYFSNLLPSSLTVWCVDVVDRVADQVVLPHCAKDHSGERAQDNHAFPRQLRQG